MRGRLRRRLGAAGVLVAALLACVSGWSPPPPLGYHRTEPVPGAGSPIGAEACQACHPSDGDFFLPSGAHADCESCHGAGELHVQTFEAANIRYPSSRDCATCHRIGSRTLLGWSSSPHARSNVICSDCHNPHNHELYHLRKVGRVEDVVLSHAAPSSRLCVGCHPDVRAQLGLPSHHPIAEGMLRCTDCHDPHEGHRESLGARTNRCTVCHQEEAGPWIYDHPPVNEDCGYCHVPHGASADFLLEASQPAACISCHTLPTAGAIHQPYAFTTDCTDCHNAVHGSYTDPLLRR